MAEEPVAECPSVKRLKMLAKVEDDVLKAGNISDAPMPYITQKITIEYRLKNDLDEDPKKFMDKLTEDLKT